MSTVQAMPHFDGGSVFVFFGDRPGFSYAEIYEERRKWAAGVVNIFIQGTGTRIHCDNWRDMDAIANEINRRGIACHRYGGGPDEHCYVEVDQAMQLSLFPGATLENVIDPRD